MKTGGIRTRQRLCALLLMPVLLLSCCLSARAGDAGMDVTMVLAQDAVKSLDIRDGEGNLLVPRKAPEMNGRGIPEVKGEEPDYRGVVGYMALQSDWEVSRFSTFTRIPWMLPVYDEDGETVAGEIQHKTPVLVTDQRIREGQGGRFIGMLRVIRLDTRQVVWIDAANFVTVPYWTLTLKEASGYGFSIAVYRSRSRYEPMDRKKHHGPLPDGIWVLMCDKAVFPRHNSPDKENRPLLGIIFRNPKSEKESYLRFFLFFNTDDLTLVY